ncbi:hypothetical protein O23A_P3p0055 (plasmid) [Aeromonas salmonicida]|nr:hypothetical protein O23A_P3p0055 [Aeromonas salmonicida]
MPSKTINFDYHVGVLDAAWVEQQLEFSWFKGDDHVLVCLDNSEVDSLPVPDGASIRDVKTTIRQYVKRKS